MEIELFLVPALRHVPSKWSVHLILDTDLAWRKWYILVVNSSNHIGSISPESNLRLCSSLVVLSDHHFWFFSGKVPFFGDWKRLSVSIAPQKPLQKHSHPPSQQPLVSAALPTHCVLWDYVQNAVHSAGAYTSHTKSNFHWEACNTTPAEPDKPPILPLFCSQTIISLHNTELGNKEK